MVTKTMTTTTTTGPSCDKNKDTPEAQLICQPGSHFFEDRTIPLDNPVKVGRAMVRARSALDNAIFDCRVLSRNHALLWYEEARGKFFIKDTKSSNGTFVNKERLSQAAEESVPVELKSGDFLQFGVEVLENSRKIAHGCIIASLCLRFPKGKSQSSSSSCPSLEHPLNFSSEDLFQLNQYIQEALARERLLDTKLTVLQEIIKQIQVASGQSWQALIDEDRLLARIEILERQLAACATKNEDKLKEEVKWILEEKEVYQQTAKATLKKLVDEKLEVVKKAKCLETAFHNTEDELATLNVLYDKDVIENQHLSQQVSILNSELEEIKKVVNSSPQASANPPSKTTSVTYVDKEVITDPMESSPPAEEIKSSELEEATERLRVRDEELRELREKLSHLESIRSDIDPSKDSFKVLETPSAQRTEEEYERDLIQAEKKIAKLILVKEKYVHLANEKKLIEEDNVSLKEKMEALMSQSQTATACYTFSFGILLVAIIIAFLPYLSALFGTIG